MTDSSRRDFFRRAFTEAARGAKEVVPLVEPLSSLMETAPAHEPPRPAAEGPPRTVGARAPSRVASIDEMAALAAELGLGSRDEDLRRLAVVSGRLRPGTETEASSFAGGEPAVPASVELPNPEGGAAQFIAAVEVPGGHRLWLFRIDPETASDGSPEPADAEGPEFVAVLEPENERDAGGPAPVPAGGRSLGLSPELTLPRPWSKAVAPLGLSAAEAELWQDLRTALAEAQGVPLGESATRETAIHRSGGYPDERRGDMPLICELSLLGVDLEGRPPATHPLAGAIEDTVGDWRLLVQLGADDDLGWRWGAGFERLYVWGLANADATGFEHLKVIVQ